MQMLHQGENLPFQLGMYGELLPVGCRAGDRGLYRGTEGIRTVQATEKIALLFLLILSFFFFPLGGNQLPAFSGTKRPVSPLDCRGIHLGKFCIRYARRFFTVLLRRHCRDHPGCDLHLGSQNPVDILFGPAALERPFERLLMLVDTSRLFVEIGRALPQVLQLGRGKPLACL